MKIKEFLKVFKAPYIVIVDPVNSENNYLKTNELTPEQLEAEMGSAENLGILKKSLFENADNSDYVPAIAITLGEEVEINQSNQRPNPDILGGFFSPEMLENMTNSPMFQEMLNPENLSKIMESDMFKQFVSNDPMLNNILNIFDNSSEDDDEEFEEIDEDE